MLVVNASLGGRLIQTKTAMRKAIQRRPFDVTVDVLETTEQGGDRFLKLPLHKLPSGSYTVMVMNNDMVGVVITEEGQMRVRV